MSPLDSAKPLIEFISDFAKLNIHLIASTEIGKAKLLKLVCLSRKKLSDLQEHLKVSAFYVS